MSERTCARCGCTPADVEFRKDAKASDGLGTYCKPCDRAKAKAYRAADRRPLRGCSVEGCGVAVHARGLCGKHYSRKNKTGTTEKPLPRLKICLIDACENRPVARGWCGKHYSRWQTYGDPLAPTPPREPKQERTCEREGCDAKHHALGLCRTHWSAAYYQRNYERSRTYQAAYRAVNAEEIRENTRRWREANPDRAKEAVRQYYRENKERIKVQRREYRDKNRDLIRALNNRRKALKRNAPINDLTGIQWREIKAAYGQRCAYCGKRPKKLTMDHVVPLSKGGSHTASNIVPACGPCNFSKNDRPAPAYQPLLL